MRHYLAFLAILAVFGLYTIAQAAEQGTVPNSQVSPHIEEADLGQAVIESNSSPNIGPAIEEWIKENPTFYIVRISPQMVGDSFVGLSTKIRIYYLECPKIKKYFPERTCK